MNAFIMFLLFLLNIITIFAVIILFLRQNRLLGAENNQKEAMAEMEELMGAFLMEMKEENELLAEKLHRLNDPQKNKGSAEVSAKTAERTFHAPQREESRNAAQKTGPLVAKIPKSKASAYNKQTNLDEMEESRGYEPPAGLTTEKDKAEISARDNRKNIPEGFGCDASEQIPPGGFKETLQSTEMNDGQTLSQRVLEMHDKGMKAEEIARYLNKGKTEIELLLKFRV
jgi:hypothetical protein